MTKPEINNLALRVKQVEESNKWNPSQEEIIVGFINQLPAELRTQVVEYIKYHIRELEGETST